MIILQAFDVFRTWFDVRQSIRLVAAHQKLTTIQVCRALSLDPQLGVPVADYTRRY